MTGLTPTPSSDTLERRFSDFETLGEALDYAAQGARGLNFHDMRGELARPYPFSEMRKDALDVAYRLISHGVKKEDRIALIAETGPEFAAIFFGAWPVPLPLPTSFGGKESYIDQIMVQLNSCDPSSLFFPPELAEMAGEAAKRCNVEGVDWAEFNDRIALKTDLPQATTNEICYLQYSRLDPLPAWRSVDAQGVAQQPFGAQPRDGIEAAGSLRILAPLVSRHGAGRLLPLRRRQPGVDRLHEDRGFCPPSARMA